MNKRTSNVNKTYNSTVDYQKPISSVAAESNQIISWCLDCSSGISGWNNESICEECIKSNTEYGIPVNYRPVEWDLLNYSC